MARDALDRQAELNDGTKPTLSGLAQREDVGSMIAFLNSKVAQSEENQLLSVLPSSLIKLR